MKRHSFVSIWVVLFLALSACNTPTVQDNSAELTATIEALNHIVAGTQTALAQQAQVTAPPQVLTDTPLPPEAPTATPVPSATPIVHSLYPAEPGPLSYWIWDRESASTANEKRALGGDVYSANQYERPFSQSEMLYRPDLDIVRADLTVDANFHYVLISLYDTNPQTGGLEGAYGVEIDLDKDGRGDYLVMADKPLTTSWDTLHVRAYTDTNNDVGGPIALGSDAPFTTGNGYDQMLFAVEIPADPDIAWARLSPSNPRQVQIAFRNTLIGGATQFLWGVFADDALRAPEKMDYNDFFTLAEAGSPLLGQADYPLKALHSFDNTCKLAHGFTPTGSEPGLCKLADPTPTPTTRPLGPATINVLVFEDRNNDGVHQTGEPGVSGRLVFLFRGLCTSFSTADEINAHITDANGRWTFNDVPAGDTCVYLDTVEALNTPKHYAVTVVGDTTYYYEFGLIYLYRPE